MTGNAEDCGFSTAIVVIGGKWKATILWELHVAPRRFGRLRQLIPGISEKVLAAQLREMERDGIIDRRVFEQSPPKVVYSLTAHGAALNAGVHALAEWGQRHRRRPAPAIIDDAGAVRAGG